MSGPSADAARRTVLLATRSVHKRAELRALLHLPHTRLVTLDELAIEAEAVEDGPTFAANARLKARFYGRLAGLPTLADDSGLEVTALDDGPGVRTRRYAGEAATDEDNNRRLLAALDGLPPDRRGARYVCVLVFLADPGAGVADAPPLVCTATFEGRIATGPRGTGGFGYDPVFEPLSEPPGGRTVGLYSAAEKNAVSHRAQAARAMGRELRARGY
ncbi:MAG: non-canonical purine NTP pyrophosphatase [Candidatus Limnocylindrales bacterium]